MSRRLTGWRPALRMARREAAHSKARTALVVALIAIPVGALAFSAVMLRTTSLSARQQNAISLGSEADAVMFPIQQAVANPSSQTLPRSVFPATMPAGVTFADVMSYGPRLKMGGKYHETSLLVANATNDLLRSLFIVTRGRVPIAASEIAVSAASARAYHLHLGDTVSALRTQQEWRVVGVYEQPDVVGDRSVLVHDAPRAAPDYAGIVRYVKAAPDVLRQLKAPSLDGSRYDFSIARDPSLVFQGSTDPLQSVVRTLTLYTAGTLGLFIVGIVVSAAFAVSARRQLHSVGLAGASGASPRHVRITLAMQGLAAGVVALVAGAAIAAIGLRIVAPRLNGIVGKRLPGIRVVPVDMIAVGGLALATATIAALVPAMAVARTPVTTALAGRRPLRPAKARTPILGALAFGIGIVVLGVSVTRSHTNLGTWVRYTSSGGLMLFGAVLSMPWLVGKFEPLARRARGASRLAARSMARNRPRTGPIAAAVLAAAGATMALATFDESLTIRNHRASSIRRPDVVRFTAASYDPETGRRPVGQPDTVTTDRVSALLPRATRIDAAELVFNDGTHARWPVPFAAQASSAIFVARYVTMDAEALAVAGASQLVVAAYRNGAVVIAAPGFVHDGSLSLQTEPSVGSDSTTVPAVESGTLAVDTNAGFVCDPGCHPTGPPTIVVPAARLADLRLAPSESFVIWKSPAPLTSHQRQQLRALNTAFFDEQNVALEAGATAATTASVDFVDFVSASRSIQAILLAAVTLATLAITAIGLALSAAEARSDDATLLALGAPPRLHRARRAWEALLTAGPACLLAVPLGFAPAAVALYNGHRTDAPHDPVVFPWRTALGLGVALPLVAAGVFWLLSRPRRAVLLRDD